MGTSDNRYGSIRNLEEKRIKLQNVLDSKNSIEYRRHEGQFATPFALAKEITDYALSLVDSNNISFLEPAVGTGAFISAFLDCMNQSQKEIIQITGIEKDSGFSDVATNLWENATIINEDFFHMKPEPTYDLSLCNPPYVRHHYLTKEYKKFLNDLITEEIGYSLSGLAGLYCYFLIHSLKWMKPGAICGWLIPSEFMDVNYGKRLKEFLVKNVTLLHIHKYSSEERKFDDALVSSCVVWLKNTAPTNNYSIKMSYNGTLSSPEYITNITSEQLLLEKKWNKFFLNDITKHSTDSVRLGDLFDVKRGLATGDNDFFILSKEQIMEHNLDMDFFKPILPSPRFLKTNEIERDSSGFPNIEQQLFLLDCTLSEEELKKVSPPLFEYIKSGEETTAKKYLCRNRKKWYYQERRQIAPMLCSYMGRGSRTGSAFRFILNHSDAIATNSYLLLYPTDYLVSKLKSNEALIHDIWASLNSIADEYIRQEGREYGGGLKKIEPKELENLYVPIML